MRDNLIFHGIKEESGEKDNDCVSMVLELIEEKLEIAGAKATIRLNRAHHLGKYNNTKTRPIVAKFVYYPEPEIPRGKKSDQRRSATPLWNKSAVPKMEVRKRLVPIMLEAPKTEKGSLHCRR